MPRKTFNCPLPRIRGSGRFNEAAARCRGKRPRRRRPRRPAAGFNEAAARCRGKQRGHRGREAVDRASMRPRPDAAENGRHLRAAGREPAARFNEAAARCRGKRAGPGRPPPACWRFNEAAARCRGKRRSRARPHRAGRLASMRPRPDAAENARSGARSADGPAAGFNEAAARCRGKRGDRHQASVGAAALQ